MSEQSGNQRRIQVAILGGGCGAMAAAFYLTSTAELRERYEVTVYQLGWRLGGKGATGRDPRKDYGNRVYEHGLHLWLGWYDNAFNVIQQVYAEWQKKPGNPFRTWSDAFQAQHFFTLQQDIAEPAGGVRWVTRNVPLPKLPGTPGYGASPLSLIEYLEALIRWMEHFAHLSGLPHPPTGGGQEALPPDPLHEATAAKLSGMMAAQGAADPANARPSHPFLTPVWNAIMRLKMAVPWEHPDGTIREALPLQPQDHAAARGASHYFLEGFQKWLQLEVTRAFTHANDDLKWYWEALDFMGAVALGIIRDVLPNEPNGALSINGLDFREWITKHGADAATQWSALTRTVYNLAFAFKSGVPGRDQASMEAGTALMIYLRMALGYKDAPMFRMRAGMGDTIFAPIYEVLKARGVGFKFFHKVTNLGLSRNRRLIESISMDVQARVKGGGEYEPLVPIQFKDGAEELPCWPLEPLWNQLEDGEALEQRVKASGVGLDSGWSKEAAGATTLVRGKDFDFMVLGVSIAGLKAITSELADADPAWRQMLAQIGTVQTQAAQLWMTPALADLGWPDAPTVMATYQEPFDTWAEMSEILKFENWQGASVPGSLQYICGPMEGPDAPPIDDPAFPANAQGQVEAAARKWLGSAIAHIWPKATDPLNPAGLNYNLLVDPAGRTGAERLAAQWLRANIDPSERYVCSFPGTSVSRLRSEDSGFDNLFLAGDWTVSSVNGGCVEAAVESGMAASRGICGTPENIPNYPEPST
jgi:uncharacterized protein with NAD-binding domain and iron-sulfur cluster